MQWARIDSVNIPLPDVGETTSFFGGSASNSFWFSGGDGGFTFWHLYRTTDRGLTWVRRDPGGGTRFPTFANTTHGICAGWVPSKEMRRTTDGGDTWSTEDMSFLPFTPLLFGYVPGTLNSYVLTNGIRPGFSSTRGCAYTTNGGDSWTVIDTVVSRGLSSFASPTTGWAPGDFGVVYKWNSNVFVTSVNQTDEIAQDFRLEQNYPNPFNPSTKIGFKVQGSGFTSLKVYDILGREVRTLVSEHLQPGSYEVTFDAAGLASGVYFYHLQAGEFTQAKRLLLLR